MDDAPRWILATNAIVSGLLSAQGPPGRLLDMVLARRLVHLIPPPSLDERLEITGVLSAADRWPGGLAKERPFRAPHHTTSYAGLVGGGAEVTPGEITLAHRGVLFLDEMPEFRKDVLEVMRQPMEDGKVTISRATISLTYPAQFMLAGAMNPCPCGYFGDTSHDCHCALPHVQKYRARISGPLMDRIDLHIEVPAVKFKELASDSVAEHSAAIRKRVPDMGRAADRVSRDRHDARGEAHRELEPVGVGILEGAEVVRAGGPGDGRRDASPDQARPDGAAQDPD